MFVRLAFAVAINIDPEILIVDEALSVGDTFFQAKCYKKFDEFKRQGKTIVFVSHDLSSISKYCDKVFLLNKGKLLGEGTAKEMIDIYKQVLVGQYDTGEDDGNAKKNDSSSSELVLNPNTEEYGNGQAYIKDVYFTDEGGRRTNTIIKGSRFDIHVKVKFEEFVPEPIFAFTFTDVKGTDITGTNTMLERAFTESCSAGDVVDVTFSQVMNLQGGNYLLSMGVTGHRDANFEVYHRLYYCLDITVVSDKDTVGYYDMMSDITATKQ